MIYCKRVRKARARLTGDHDLELTNKNCRWHQPKSVTSRNPAKSVLVPLVTTDESETKSDKEIVDLTQDTRECHK